MESKKRKHLCFSPNKNSNVLEEEKFAQQTKNEFKIDGTGLLNRSRIHVF